MGLNALLQGIFPTQGSNPHLHWQVDSYHWATREAMCDLYLGFKIKGRVLCRTLKAFSIWSCSVFLGLPLPSFLPTYKHIPQSPNCNNDHSLHHTYFLFLSLPGIITYSLRLSSSDSSSEKPGWVWGSSYVLPGNLYVPVRLHWRVFLNLSVSPARDELLAAGSGSHCNSCNLQQDWFPVGILDSNRMKWQCRWLNS